MHDSLNTGQIGPDDEGWDSVSAFTGKPLTQAQREANDARRVKNMTMLAGLPGGRRHYKVNRMIAVGGTQKSPKTGPRVFYIDGVGGSASIQPNPEHKNPIAKIGFTFSGADAIWYADQECGAAYKALPKG